MWILMLFIYIGILPIILISFKSIGIDEEFKDYSKCSEQK